MIGGNTANCTAALRHPVTKTTELMESLSNIGFNEIKESKFYNGFE